MAQVQSQHVAPLTSGFCALLVFAIIGMGVLNKAANRR